MSDGKCFLSLFITIYHESRNGDAVRSTEILFNQYFILSFNAMNLYILQFIFYIAVNCNVFFQISGFDLDRKSWLVLSCLLNTFIHFIYLIRPRREVKLYFVQCGPCGRNAIGYSHSMTVMNRISSTHK